jgi:hypothetical protein
MGNRVRECLEISEKVIKIFVRHINQSYGYCLESGGRFIAEYECLLLEHFLLGLDLSSELEAESLVNREATKLSYSFVYQR